MCRPISSKSTSLSDRRELILDSIARAPAWKLSEKILAITSLGTAPARRCALLNLLCRMGGLDGNCRYLEFGSFMGQSLLAAAWQADGSFRGVENFSQFTSLPARDTLRANLARARELGCPSVTPASVQEIDWRRITCPGPVDVFFYDAEHDADATRDALRLIAPWLAAPAVVVVDDWELPSWSGYVQSGVFQGLDGVRVIEQWELGRDEGWHEGVYVALVGGPRR
jgi:predicted O-methyltransferase YrrM